MDGSKDKKFNKGDVVQLKSGGPIMTVNFYQSNYASKGPVVCDFFVGTEKKQEVFDEELLKFAEN